MQHLTREQSIELEKASEKESGITGEILMRNAGREIKQVALTMVRENSNPKIFIICGKGNNGGDGFAAAIELFKENIFVSIHYIGLWEEVNGVSKTFYDRCIKLKISISYGLPILYLKKPDLIIDALFGTGLNRSIDGDIAQLIDWINLSNTKVLSIDIPSGLDSNNGYVLSKSVKADTTLTMGAPKIGMNIGSGAKYSGNIIIADIGFPKKSLLGLSGIKWELLNLEKVNSSIIKPDIDTNKFNQGKVLIIAGSLGMSGAAMLSTLAVLKSGAGMTITAIPKTINNIFESNIIEGISLPLPDKGLGYLQKNHFDKILDKSSWADVLIIGPGLGRETTTQSLVRALIKKVKKPIILDADGLYPFANDTKSLIQRKEPLIITPHLGELSLITGIEVKEIINNYTTIISDFMVNFPHVAFVKHVPSCTFYKKSAIMNISGNPGLSTAGTGDVLTGVIAGFLSGGVNPQLATILGAFIHGKASDCLVNKKGYRGQIASDLLELIPRVIASYEKG
tara:strand:- start:8545 stop:10077 length:1533 start_codon:yes stop_codon:yes gene_type:complete